jgi:hypothetical protein
MAISENASHGTVGVRAGSNRPLASLYFLCVNPGFNLVGELQDRHHEMKYRLIPLVTVFS